MLILINVYSAAGKSPCSFLAIHMQLTNKKCSCRQIFMQLLTNINAAFDKLICSLCQTLIQILTSVYAASDKSRAGIEYLLIHDSPQASRRRRGEGQALFSIGFLPTLFCLLFPSFHQTSWYPVRSLGFD